MPINIYKNKTEINNDIFDYEKELANTILFSPGPKNFGANSIKNNYPYPYYDPTYYNRINNVNILKNKILNLKSEYEKLDKEENKKNKENDNDYKYNINNNMKYRINDNHNDNKEFKSNFNFFTFLEKENNNELNLYIVINNSTYPNKLDEFEKKLKNNNYTYEEKNISDDDILKEQVDILKNAYKDNTKDTRNLNKKYNNNKINKSHNINNNNNNNIENDIDNINDNDRDNNNDNNNNNNKDNLQLNK
jgi:hypothetical protein